MDRCHYDKIVKLCRKKSKEEVGQVVVNLGLTTLEWLELRKICGKRKGLYNLKCQCMKQAFRVASRMADWVAIAERGDLNHRIRALQEIARYPIRAPVDLQALRNSTLSALSLAGYILAGGPEDSPPALGQIIRI